MFTGVTMANIDINDIEGAYSTENLDLEKLFLDLYVGEILAAPNTIFPQETAKRVYEKVTDYVTRFSKNELQKCKKFTHARVIAHTFFDSYYSFSDNLKTGQYAPYAHEQLAANMSGNNCTNIIPEVYLWCEALNLKPQIVQFFDFKDIKLKKDEEEAISPSHFSLILEVGRKHKYLLDPFYSTFGPIVEQQPDYIKVGKSGGRPARKRIFREMLPYSAEQFVQMMDRLHRPAESLDMLVAGQKVYSSQTIAKHRGCVLMVYYHDEKNTLSTRLYAPQKPLSDKAVYGHMKLNDDGDITDQSLELFLAKDSGWDSLVQGKKVAQTDLAALRKLRRELHQLSKPDGKKFRIQNHQRLGPALLVNERASSSLADLTESMYQNLSMTEQQALHPLVLARTLYEYERPSENYLYAPEEHDARLLALALKEKEGLHQLEPLKNLLWFRDWKLQKVDSDRVRRARAAIRRHDEKMMEVVEEINALNHLRYNHKKAYSRSMDKVLFAKTLEGKNLDDLESMVAERNLDPRLGYVAMVADFIPFVLEAQDDLELKLYRQPIKEKVIHRRRQKNSIKMDTELVVISDMEMVAE